ncbi:MAG: DUF1015 domain-containing protein [Deltaproteobacteria bacterium]|nr:DUF1015 domain-containing protein [Deltaproteobacteria bacterium]
MASVIPFKAARPVREYVKEVASYPYDVIDSREARHIAKGNSKSFLHVIKSEIDLPEHIDPYDDKVYAKARENLKCFLDKGILFQDEEPCFYVYRQKVGDHEQYGIAGCVSVADYESGHIKKHELTREDKETDRTRHMDIINAQPGPILMTYRAEKAIDDVVKRVVKGEPEYDFVSDDGISHAVWVISDRSEIKIIEDAFLKIESIYIADGHHRTASAARVAEKRRKENPDHKGNEEYNYMLAVLFPDNQVKIMDYNRAVTNLGGMTEEEFLDKLSEKFSITGGFEDRSPREPHVFGMYLKGRWYKVSAKEGTFDNSDVVDILDVSILQRNLLSSVLGIGDIRTDKRITFIGGIRGMDELERLVNSGDYAVAFSLFPTTVRQLMDVADAAKVMPPKSTWFEPKLRSGIFVHLF